MSPVPATYKAYTYEQYGKIEDVLKITQVPTGLLAADRVRIKVHSAAINSCDHKVIEESWIGEYVTGGKPSAEKPYKLGGDGAGVIAEVGEDVTNFSIGDEVFWMADFPHFGSFAEYFEIEAKFVVAKPKNLDFDQAASVPVVAITSYQALFQEGNLQAGQRVLVLGGSSSCGIYGIQFAKAIGAHVVATTSAKNTEFVKSIGADETIDYHSQKWVDVLEKHSIDLIYDCGVEPESWNTDAQVVLKHGGRFVELLLIPELIESPIGATPILIEVKSSGADLAKIAQLIESGKVKPVIDSVVPFDKLRDGLSRVKMGRTVGKIIVKII